jgi:hypothetical protein
VTPLSVVHPRRLQEAASWRLEKRTRELRRLVRLTTSPLRVRPTFLVIGGVKCGTTSLHRYLCEHPAVLCATVKEVHYFSLRYPLGERWYRAQFPLAPRQLGIRVRRGTRPAVGEATPAYIFDPRAPRRVHAFDERMRLIAILRDPVERAYAHYQWEVATRDETRSFEDALAWEEDVLAPELERWIADPSYAPALPVFGRSYVARGRYAEQLDRWLELFPRDQMLVLTTDDLLADPAGVMTEVAQFLGIPGWTADSYPLENVSTYAPMSPVTREHLAGIFDPHNRRLERLLGRELNWTRPAHAHR